MPGLAASPKIFEFLEFSQEKYELHYLHWKMPLSKEESIANYAQRMSTLVKTENPVLIGVSFGGIIVQEMSKFLTLKKIIIISSLKTSNEMPKRYKLAKAAKLYKLFPTKMISNFEEYTKFFFGENLQRKAEMYKKYLSVRDKTYLAWSMQTVLNWEQEIPLKNLIHIHGTKDHIFPIKSISKSIEIKDGTHSMVLIKAKEISQIIDSILTF
jgi:esterase/lipase